VSGDPRSVSDAYRSASDPARDATPDLQRGLVVALETSSRSASVAARAGGRTLAHHLAGERAHASDLLPALDRLVMDLGAKPRDLVAVLVGTGPGSYTGLRVGIATALGLARASGAAILGVPSGETLCFGELAAGGEGIYLLDARSAEIYYARYRRLEHEVETIAAPRVVEPGSVEALLASEVPSVPIFGDATVAEAARLGADARAQLRSDVAPRAEMLLELGLARLARGLATPLAAVEPLYLRPFTVRGVRR
jgi:tRNA threonylcarbamoyladenosine biosynthesis protein TsaB